MVRMRRMLLSMFHWGQWHKILRTIPIGDETVSGEGRSGGGETWMDLGFTFLFLMPHILWAYPGAFGTDSGTPPPLFNSID